VTSPWPGYPVNFTWDTPCADNEWCTYREPHSHGLACEETCQCRLSRVLWGIPAREERR
jgi:hypothetical protein